MDRISKDLMPISYGTESANCGWDFRPTPIGRCISFFAGSDIVITHAFMKKTDRVPVEEINRALRYKQDFEERFGRDEIEYE